MNLLALSSALLERGALPGDEVRRTISEVEAEVSNGKASGIPDDDNDLAR